MKKIVLIIAFFAVIVGCSLENDEESNSKNKNLGFYFGQESILFFKKALRTALPDTTEMAKGTTDIKLYKKSAGNTFDYGEPVVTYEKWIDIPYHSKIFNLSAGTYNFKLTAKINGIDYSSEKLSVKITKTPVYLAFEIARVDEGGTGSVNIAFKADTSISSKIAKVFAKIDNSPEIEVNTTKEKNCVTGVFEKDEISIGKHKIIFYFRDENNETFLIYPISAYIYASCVSKDDFVLATGDDNTFTVCNITYNENNGTEKNTIQIYDLTSKIYTWAESALTCPNGKKFICWNTKADGSGSLYNENENPSFTESTTLYAQYLDWDATNQAYKINNKDELELLFNTKLGCQAGTKAILQNNIDIGQWVPPEKEYSGIFDGNNYSLKMSVVADNAAFIQTLNGTIKNLTISESTFSGKSTAGTFVSIVEKNGKITNCTADINVVTTSASNGISGGIAGIISEGGNVSECSVQGGSIEGNYSGGIAGKNAGEISFNTPNAVTTSIGNDTSEYSGGIAGYNEKTGIINGNGSVNLSNINGQNYGYIIGDFDLEENKYCSSNISTEIVYGNKNVLFEKQSYSVPTSSWKRWQFDITRTAKIQFTLTNTQGDGACIYGYIEALDKNGKYQNLAVTGKNDNATITKSTSYLKKGTYYMCLQNDNIVCSATGTFSIDYR